jgi:ribose transport system ATP-binding protein
MTAALPTDLVDRVLTTMRAQADAGLGVIYVSHRFPEIARLCHRATILRDGRTVGDLAIEPGVEDRAVELMLGTRIDLAARRAAAAPAPARKSTPRLRVAHLAQGATLSDVSFDLHAGEVLGVVALEGQGQDALFATLAGFRRPTGGSFEVNGRTADFRHPADAIAQGVKLVPANRAEALLKERSVHENIALPFSARPRDWGLLRLKRERARVAEAIERLQIDTRAQGEVQRLSGGNQQKVTIARWIAHGVETLLLFDPTRGIDVRTKRQIYALVRDLAAQGTAVLYYTSELEEVPLACDRAVVIFGGRTVAEVPLAEADPETLMRAAYGLAPARTGVPA